MKFLHLGDLHLGKRLYAYDLYDDQKYILDALTALAVSEGVDAVLLAGDLYDRQSPPARAVSLLDGFLTDLQSSGIQVFAVAGNHDSAERVDYAARLLEREGVHVAGAFRAPAQRYTLSDAYGPLDVWLLPFARLANIRDLLPDCPSLSDGIAAALTGVDPTRRNLLVTHQFAVASSQAAVAGSLEAVDCGLFDAFDYTALGHLHEPMQMGRPTCRYCGSPLKFSTDEYASVKSAALVTLEEKGVVRVETRPLTPLRDLRRLEGALEQVLQTPASEDFLHVRLTDRDPVPDAMKRLLARFPHVARVEWLERRSPERTGQEPRAERTPESLFLEFFENVNHRPPEERELDCFRKAGEEAGL